jgi:hypothetical protein
MVEYIFSNGTFIVICAKKRGNRILNSHVRLVNGFKGTVTSLIKSHGPSSLQPSFIPWKRSGTGPLLKGGCKGVSQAEERVNYSIKTKGRGVWVCEPSQILAL